MAETKTTQSLNIYQRMLAATSEINKVAKNLKVGVGNNSYKAVAESDVLEAVKPVEEQFGIYSFPLSREIVKDEISVTTTEYEGRKSEKASYFMRVKTIYRFVNVDKPDEYIDITTYGDGIDSQDKAPGKAMTYGDKYALLKAYKIQTGEDPDAKPSKRKTVEPPTAEQLKQAEELSIDLDRLAAYVKVDVSELSKSDLADAIEIKKKALQKKAEKEKKNTETQQ